MFCAQQGEGCDAELKSLRGKSFLDLKRIFEAIVEDIQCGRLQFSPSVCSLR
jgi:hypothetical protein